VRYLLDTCVLSEPVRKRPSKRVTNWLAAQEERQLCLSALTLGELQKGISKLPAGSRRSALRTWVERDLRARFAGRVLPVDEAVALQWGALVAESEREGRPLPVLDSLLGATALAHGLTLVTRNTSHLEGTPVRLLNPWEA